MPLFRLTCKRCGASRIALRLDRCTNCGKYVCVNCFTNQNGVNLCLDCYAVLAKNYQNRVLTSWDNVCPICKTRGQLQVTHFLMYRPQKTVMDPTGRVQLGQEYYGNITYTLELSCGFCGNNVNGETVGAISAATKAEQAGRYEDAARDYERLGYLDKAKALREMGKTTIVKHQYVDINHLLEQIRQGN